MAISKDKAAPRIQQLALRQPGKPTHKTRTKKKTKAAKNSPSSSTRRKRGRSQFLRFDEARGKIVEFVEIGTSADFPCVEIGFTDYTALLVLMDTRLTMDADYSDWKTGNQRLLRRWPVVECE